MLLVAAVFLVGPALLHPTSRVAGHPTDPAAEVWWLNEMASDRVGIVWPSSTRMVNAPDGSQLRRPVEVSTAAIDLIAWPLYQVAGPVLVRNLLLVLGLLAGGVAMLVVAAEARLERFPAVAGAVVFMYAPTLVTETRLHVALVFMFPIPLAFALGLRMLDRPTRRYSLVLGLILGSSCYVNPYVPLYTVVVVLAVALALVAKHRRGAAQPLVGVAASSVAIAAPALGLLLAKRGPTITAIRRSLGEIDQFSLTPLAIARSLGSSAIAVVVTAIALVGLSRVRDRAVVLALACCSLGGVLLSLGAHGHIFGRRMPLPNSVLFSLYPAWRVVGRAAILVWFVVAFGIACASTRVTRSTARFAFAAVAATLWIGGSYDHGRPWFAANQTPALSAALAARDGAVAEYPLFGLDNDASGPYLLRQVFHGRPLVNGARPGSVSGDIAQSAGLLDDPRAAAALSLGGVRTVVVHGTAPVPTWLQPLGEYDGSRVFDAPVVADAAIAALVDAYDEEVAGDVRWRWLPEGTSMRVTSATPGRFRVSMLVLAVGPVSTLTIGDERVAIGQEERTVEICVATAPGGPAGLARATVLLVADAAPSALCEGDPRPSVARARGLRIVGRCT